jgi:excisionase family DNA binding protein
MTHKPTVALPDDRWITITAAAKVAGCTAGYVRQLLRDHKLHGWKAGQRVWLVDRDEVLLLAEQLMTYSNHRRTTPLRPQSSFDAARDLMSVRQVMKAINARAPSTVTRLINSGRLQGARIGEIGWVIYRASVDAFLQTPPSPRGSVGFPRGAQRHTKSHDKPQKLSGTYFTVAQAADHMGCTEGWVRKLVSNGQLAAIKHGQRAWLIPLPEADKAARLLTTRSKGKKHLAHRPANARRSRSQQTTNPSEPTRTNDHKVITTPDRTLITCRKAAEILGCTMGRVRQLVREPQPQLWSTKLGARILMLDADQVAHLASSRAASRAAGTMRGAPPAGFQPDT